VRQHGLITHGQLTQLGIRPRTIGHRIERGQLHRVHRGVYAVGHALLSQKGRWMAAVLVGGEGAVLSHRSAAALWGVRPSSRTEVQVTVPSGRGRRPGIRFHRGSVPKDEVTVRNGIPITTVSRTLLDLAAVVSVRQLERAINEAEVLRLWDELSLAALAERYPRRPGTRAVRQALNARQDGETLTRSELEERFLETVRSASLAQPEVNATLEARGRSFEIDFLWREQRLAVELDGRAAHHTVEAFERDRERDRILQVAGWRTVRITWSQLDGVERDLRALLDTV
jgi:very-short-patch-repair endonuclease